MSHDKSCFFYKRDSFLSYIFNVAREQGLYFQNWETRQP